MPKIRVNESTGEIMEHNAIDLQELQDHLHGAQDILWRRIQRGQYDVPEAAKAAVDAWQHVDKARKLVSAALAQLPLPETREG